MIGRVAGYEVDSKTGYWDISVELKKMGQLNKVYVVRNLKIRSKTNSRYP